VDSARAQRPPTADRRVDIVSRRDGAFAFEEFRRDPEDMGACTPVAYYTGGTFPTEAVPEVISNRPVRSAALVEPSTRATST
jgi:hypothetical protein